MTDFSHKYADTRYPVMSEIAERWSPYLFAPRDVETDKLRACLEAARWSASSYNEQPWRFIVATRDNPEQFAKALDCLLEANQAWAKNVGVLILTAYSTNFSRNNQPNRVALHDLGLAAANLSTQAVHLGLFVHQMAGVNLAKVRQSYQVPDGFEIGTAIAIGYAAPTDDSELGARDKGTRSRKPFEDFVFSDKWGQPASILK